MPSLLDKSICEGRMWRANTGNEIAKGVERKMKRARNIEFGRVRKQKEDEELERIPEEYELKEDQGYLAILLEWVDRQVWCKGHGNA